jgi:predicted acyltransferase
MRSRRQKATADGKLPADIPAAPGRLMALDALRGFDMLWIVGAGGIVHALGKISHGGVAGFLARQLNHAPWEGFTFYDLIFPLFVFIVGVSTVFSLQRIREQTGAKGVYRRIMRRGLLLLVLGIVYSGGVSDGWEGVRLLGVLQRIAICYTVTALLCCVVRVRGLVAVCVSLLVGYWALLSLVPIRDISIEGGNLARLAAETGAPSADGIFNRTTSWVTGAFDPGRNLANHVDFLYLPGRKYDGAYDPEGLLSTLPAIATCLLGVFAGRLLLDRRVTEHEKVRALLASGVGGVVAGFLWGLQFPVIKQIWTSSFVLVAAGYSALLLAAFYQVIEIWGFKRWAVPFVWIGMNPITIYLASALVPFEPIAERLVGGPVIAGLGAYGDLLVSAVVLALTFVLAWFLHRRQIFLRL